MNGLLYKHYAKAIPGIMYAFGLYNTQDKLQAICCYGTPANNHNNELGHFKMIELVRLVANENLPKNTLSFFLSKTLKMLPTPLSIISYADQGKNHSGYIYQATNWLYTGLGGGVDYYIDLRNKEIHSRIMSDYRLKWPHLSRNEIAKKLEWTKIKGTYKHRYFTFAGDKKDKKIWRKLILEKYPLKPYPKEENKRYDASHITTNQGKLF